MNEKYNSAAEAIKLFACEAASILLAETAPIRHRNLISAAITVGLRDGNLSLELALMEAMNRSCDLAEQLWPTRETLGAPEDFGDDGFYNWLVGNIDNLVARNPNNRLLAEIRTLHARRLLVD
jgi:hypothetical protein